MPDMTVRLSLLALLLLTSLPAQASESSWPQFRGPDQLGKASAENVFRGESFGLEVAWRRPLGLGYSSIVITEGRAITMFTDGEKDVIGAFDVRTGDELWRWVIADAFPSNQGSTGGPNSTPVIAGDTVYGLGPYGDLFAVDLASGKVKWQRRFEESEAQVPYFGFSTAPVVVGDLLIVETGAEAGHAITAVDRRTGKTVWSRGDDAMTYESPLLIELAGRRQIVAATTSFLRGLDPATGEELWHHEHKLESNGANGSMPIPVGGNGLMLSGRQEVVVFDISMTEGKFSVSERWRSTAFKRTYSHPVIHQGFAYGFSGEFLTCLDVRDGSLAWRSRPPGGKSLSLVDGHLVVLGNQEGSLIIAEATSEAYLEKARLKVFEATSWTAPSFAEGLFLTRNIQELVALRISDHSTGTSTADTQADPQRYLGNFGVFVRSVEALPQGDRGARIDAFLAENSQRPLREVDGDSGFAHILYRGDVTDVAVRGNLPGIRRELVLHRIAGTNLFYRSFTVDPRGLWEYQLGIEFEDPVPDPANPEVLDYGETQMSPLAMPAFAAADHLEPLPSTVSGGTVERFAFKSEFLDNEREVTVYLPPGYSAKKGRDYPLLVVNSHQEQPFLQMENSLDQLISKKQMEAVVVAFVPRTSSFELSPKGVEKMARMLREELLPDLNKRYRVTDDASQRGVMGVGSEAFLAVSIALASDGTFGRVATQSYFARRNQGGDILEKIRAGAAKNLHFHLERRTHDSYLRRGSPTSETGELNETLRLAGIDVELLESPGGEGISSWRASQDRLLKALYPLPQHQGSTAAAFP